MVPERSSVARPPAPGATEVLQAYLHSRLVEALGLALEAWRANRDPVIAQVIDALDALARQGLLLSDKGNRGDFHQDWLALAAAPPADARARVVGWLCAHVGRMLPEGIELDPSGRWVRSGLVRLERLVALGPDPRVAAAVVEHVVAGAALNLDLADQASELAPLLEQAAEMDPRAAARLLAESDRPSSPSAMRRQLLADWVEARRDALEVAAARYTQASDRAAWQDILRMLGPSEPDPEALAQVFEQVVAALEDDQPRLVLADLYMAAEDPQGEYIALELAGRRPKEARILLRTHGQSWLGQDLSAVLVAIEYARGLPVRARLAKNGVARPEVWDRAIEDPRLGTFTELRLGVGARATYERFLFSPAARNLRGVDAPGKRAFERLCAPDEPRRFRALRSWLEPNRRVLSAIAEAPAFVGLEVLWAPWAGGGLVQLARDVEAVGLHERLTRIELTGVNEALPETLAPHEIVLKARDALSLHAWFGV